MLHFPTKYQILNVYHRWWTCIFLFHNEETGDIITQADVEIDDMIKVVRESFEVWRKY